MSMTKEQQAVFEQAVVCGLAKNDKHAYEIGCATLRQQLHTLKEEERAKRQAAERAEADAIAANQFRLFDTT